MKSCDLDALIATSPVNITYFSDYYCWLDPVFKEYMMEPGGSSSLSQGYAIFPLEGEPALVVNPLFLVNAMDSWIEDLRSYGSYGPDDSIAPVHLSEANQRIYDLTHPPQENSTPTEALTHVLRDRGLKDGRLGLEMDGLTLLARQAIEHMLPSAELKDCSNLIRLIRMVKNTEEVSRMTFAARTNEDAAMETLALARPGIRVSEMVQHFRYRVAEKGADFDHFAFGVGGQGIATETDYSFGEEEVTYVDFGCIYRNYYSDSGTTFAMCEPSAELGKRHESVQECLKAGEETMRPGVRASAVHKAMWAVLQRRGHTSSFPHGHGLGLEVRDYPIIVAENGRRIKDDCIDVSSDLTLEANMVVNLESAMFLPLLGSIHMEKSLVVTEDGCRPLVPQDRTRPVMPRAAQ